MTGAALTVEDLRVSLTVGHRTVSPVDGVSFSVGQGQAVGLVGESGSGKSLTLRAVLGLLPPDAQVEGRVSVGDGAPAARGRGVSMVFQEPGISLNPTMRVGDLVAEGVRARHGCSRSQARARAVELLRSVGVPDPARRARAWPHELSGGLKQRVMIAVALSTDPELLLCDEPTTALDVTVQDQILGLLTQLRRQQGMSLVFVSHDLAVVSEVCDTLVVMYAGQVVETGAVAEVLGAPKHPYTAALIAAVPTLDARRPLVGIGGRPPDPRSFPDGCRFAERCAHAIEPCRSAVHRLVVEADHSSSCIRADLPLGRVS